MPRKRFTTEQIITKLREAEVELTQESLAFECDLHPTYISQIERGIKSPTMGTFFRISEALGSNHRD